MKKTLVIGASENTDRYSNRAMRMLHHEKIPVVAIGLKEGEVLEMKIQKGFPKLENIDTVTLYIGPQHQPKYYDYIVCLKPRRVIFNPGTENTELEKILRKAGIEPIEACTLVMLSIGNY